MANILIVAGSVYGGAQYVAEQAQELLEEKGHTVRLTEAPQVEDVTADDIDTYLLISSTTGVGDLPDNLVAWHSQMKDRLPMLTDRKYGVIALGDSSYGDSYCGGGKQLDELFAECNASKVGERLEIDACESLQPEDDALPWIEKWQDEL